MILFFDTETTGIVDDRLAFDDPRQPHVVQLAAQLCEDDGKPAPGFSLIIDPYVEIPPAAVAVHGITTARAKVVGVDFGKALAVFSHFYRLADLLVAHNMKFDKAIMEIAVSRQYKQVRNMALPTYCTMEASAPILNLPPTERMKAAGIEKPKPPKLSECVKRFFDEDLAGAHDAWADMRACRRVYLHLKSIT